MAQPLSTNTPTSHLQVKRIGITQLIPSESSSDIVVDICFVHGLGGHPQKTWQYGEDVEAELAAPKKSSKLSRRWPWSKKQALDHSALPTQVESRGQQHLRCLQNLSPGLILVRPISLEDQMS